MNIQQIFEYTIRETLYDRPIHAELDRTVRGLHQNKHILQMLDDAQDELCEYTHCIRDDITPDVAVFSLVNGEDIVQISPYTLTIYNRGYYLDADNRRYELCRLKNRVSPHYICPGDKPRYFDLIDMGNTQHIKLYPGVQQDNLTMYFDIARKPIVRFTENTGETKVQTKFRLQTECEIPRAFHERLVDYVMWRSLGATRDVDKEAKAASESALERWKMTKVQLNREIQRRNTIDEFAYANPMRLG